MVVRWWLLLVLARCECWQPTECPHNETWPCVPKCCHMGQALDHASGACLPSAVPFDPIFAGGPDPGPNCLRCNLVVGEPCPDKYPLDVDDDYRLFANGSLRLWDGEWLGPDDFCVDAYWSEARGLAVALPLLCYQGTDAGTGNGAERAIRYVLYPLGLLVSVPFLVATAWLYLRFPELRDLHGRALANHAICLAAAYLSLSATQLAGDRFSAGACIAFAFLIQFSFLAAFCWLTILAVDTTWKERDWPAPVPLGLPAAVARVGGLLGVRVAGARALPRHHAAGGHSARPAALLRQAQPRHRQLLVHQQGGGAALLLRAARPAVPAECRAVRRQHLPHVHLPADLQGPLAHREGADGGDAVRVDGHQLDDGAGVVGGGWPGVRVAVARPRQHPAGRHPVRHLRVGAQRQAHRLRWKRQGSAPGVPLCGERAPAARLTGTLTAQHSTARCQTHHSSKH